MPTWMQCIPAISFLLASVLNLHIDLGFLCWSLAGFKRGSKAAV